MILREYLRAFPRFSRDSWLILATAGLGGFSYQGIYFLLGNLLLLRLDYGPEFIGIFVSAGALSFAVFSLVAGIVGRRWGGRLVAIAGIAVTAVGIGMLSLAPLISAEWQPSWLISFCVLREFGNAFYLVNVTPLLMAATTPAERGHVFSMRGAVTPLAAFAGSVAGGILPGVSASVMEVPADDPVGYTVTLLVAAATLLPGVGLLAATRRRESSLDGSDRSEDGCGRSQGGSETVSLPRGGGPGRLPYGPIAAMAVVGVLFIAAMAAVMGFVNMYMDQQLQVQPERIGMAIGAGHLAAVPVGLTMAVLASRWGYARTFILAATGLCVSALLVALIPSWEGASAGVIGITAFGAMAFPALNVYQQELVSPQWRSIMSGVAFMAF
ncbi:MAG TPA: MFS transporter, partial [Candidatus Latescibacteria bacterium]|nr:MFS transporter [Candidatus Latescibacterota bacterium]